MAKTAKRKHRKNKPRAKKYCPGDNQGFTQFVQSRSRRIARLVGHLQVIDSASDYQNRRLLENLIDERGAALSSPPETVSPELVESLREEVRNG